MGEKTIGPDSGGGGGTATSSVGSDPELQYDWKAVLGTPDTAFSGEPERKGLSAEQQAVYDRSRRRGWSPFESNLDAKEGRNEKGELDDPAPESH